ncbi:uncharacterized protein A4U43_C03F13930 [Asparagus officinalis]|uniref:F-box domain-containing protein n=1 Tax=Asparagus officinalis TaxID=4686 RepID=A0A5P1F9W8_ASPOF|nr:F-box only protein 13 [Asparagus officinalis]XP_020256990.1 F-box only protein 13 [Asparagus officinalis]XP_020256991.1 F-box only protein 13 [Asparagus officinalis]XP_020256992.1 F-box only protein 13 [Asparagus officinalis]ONK75155.1 uncharacterized protein A4U43_C03F13930 [Asparagus officinalis]
MDATKSLKRKSPDSSSSSISPFPFNELNQDLLEKVLSRLPPSSFFRLRSVCKSWNNISSSTTFHLACSEVQSRDPWFLMVGQDLNQSIVFDTSDGSWKNLTYPNFLQQTQFSKSIPVASSGGLVCFRSSTGLFVVCNPIAGACFEIPNSGQACEGKTLNAIAMSSSTKNLSSYRIVQVLGEFPNLSVRVFDSEKKQWENEFLLRKSNVGSVEDEPETMYFLSKAGDVVATNMQRSPSKQYSSVLIKEANDEEVVYFLSQSGTVLACNLALKTFNEYPRLLPIYFEYSIDVVECNGELLVIVLSDFLETASLRIWKFSKEEKSWLQVAAMPPSLSHDFFGKKADINCVGFGSSILICISSSEFSSYVMFNLVDNEWVELPKCFVNGRAKEFMSAFSFEPRIEISV